MKMKQACEIVYAGMSIGQDTCHHEWYQGKCIHCNLTADWGHAVRELNAKIGVEHVRTVEAERKNKNLLAEVERLTMELNAVTNGEYTKQDVELEKLRADSQKAWNEALETAAKKVKALSHGLDCSCDGCVARGNDVVTILEQRIGESPNIVLGQSGAKGKNANTHNTTT